MRPAALARRPLARALPARALLSSSLIALAAVPPAAAETLRIAAFNAALSRDAPGALAAELASGESAQAAAVAEIVQRVNPDILFLAEFDFDAEMDAARAFRDRFLAVSQNGAAPIGDYRAILVAPSNTGLLSGRDLDRDGHVATQADLGTRRYGGDSYGYGEFPGQYAFAVFSRLEIVTEEVRSFQHLLWADMPGALLKTDPALRAFYGEAAGALRLSSKTHIDVPLRLESGGVLHLIGAHPTPPVFDGPEDRNGKRNHDEIRFIADYVGGADWPVDDAGRAGGLAPGARFVIVGDMNADPFDGDSVNFAARLLTEHPLVQGSAVDPAITPASEGAAAATARQRGVNETHDGPPEFDTADFGFDPRDPETDTRQPGNIRVDYVLPSVAGLRYVDGGVFWLAPDDPLWPLGEWPTSDHRLVWIDVEVVPAE